MEQPIANREWTLPEQEIDNGIQGIDITYIVTQGIANSEWTLPKWGVANREQTLPKQGIDDVQQGIYIT